MPNNNKIAISRGYAIKTADLSIYNRDQSEFVVEKNTVVVSALCPMAVDNEPAIQILPLVSVVAAVAISSTPASNEIFHC